MRTIVTNLIVLAALAHASSAAAALRLSLSAKPGGYVLGEPVTVRVTLTNAGDAPATAPRQLEPEYGDVRYSIGRGDGQSTPFAPWAVKEAADAIMTLEPGASVEDDADIFFGAQGWVFREVGTYTVVASYADVVSPPLEVVIQAPSSVGEREAADRLLGTPEAGRFLVLRGGDHLRQGMRALQEVAQDHPSTSHAAYANLALGLNQLRPARDFATGQARPANPQRALDFLKQARDERFGLERTVEKQLGVASAYRQLGRDGDAATIERELPRVLEQRFPQADVERFRATELPAIRARIMGEAR